MDLGNAIKTLRKEKKITRTDLAKRSNISITALYNIENNLSLPTKDTLDKLCDGLGIPVSYLMFFSITEDDVPVEKRNAFKYLAGPMKEFLMGE